MSDSPSALQAIQQMISDVDDTETAMILTAMAKVVEQIEQLQSEVAQMRQLVSSMEQKLLTGARTSSNTAETLEPSHELSSAGTGLEPPLFVSDFSEYEAGVLFENVIGFDLRLQFQDPKSWEWYRIWGFQDAGQVLHSLLESCARTACTSDMDRFTYRRDIHSATVYATDRQALERLLSAFLQATDSDEGTLRLLEQMDMALRD